jgi:cell division protein FtsB
VNSIDARRKHEGAAIAQMRAAIKALETAVNDASHGAYSEAEKVAKVARDRLYVADIELRKAEVAALRGSS